MRLGKYLLVHFKIYLVLTGLAFQQLKAEENTHSNFQPVLPFNCEFADEVDFYVLDNGMKVLLIQDEDTITSEVALSVLAGYRDDPKDVQGMAHLLEHMLFLGTKSFPDASQYRHFLRTHGGDSNATTHFDHTNYFFDVDSAFLDKALSMFAEQFHAPALDSDQISKEKAVVNAEYEMRKGNLYRQLSAVAKDAFFETNDINTFGIGNAETLSIYDDPTLSTKMKSWFNEHYSADKMALVIYDNKPISELKTQVKKYFSEIKKTSTPKNAVLPNANLKNTAPRIARAYINDEDDGLLFLFPSDVIQDDHRLSATNFVRHMLLRSMPNTFMSGVRGYNYSDDVYIDTGHELFGKNFIEIYIPLYGGGGKRYWQVSKMLMYYVNELKKKPLEEWRLEEFNRLQEIKWCYTHDKDMEDYAYNLLKFDPNYVFSAGYYAAEYKPEIYQTILESISVDNLFATVASPSFSGSDSPSWFDIEYSEEEMSKLARRKANTSDWSELYIKRPEANQYLPDHVDDIADNVAEIPTQLKEFKPANVWYARNTIHSDPRAFFYVEVTSPGFDNGRRNSALSNLLESVLEDRLTYDQSTAKDVNNYMTISRIENGFGLYFEGYSDSITSMLQKVLNEFSNFKVNEKTFSLFRRNWMAYLKGSDEIAPGTQANSFRTDLLTGPPYPYKELYKGMRSAGYHHLKSMVKEIKQDATFTSLSFGNVKSQDALKWNTLLSEVFVNGIKNSRKQIFRDTVKLPSKLSRVYSQSDYDESVSLIYVQALINSYKEKAHFKLLSSFLSEEFFNQLRTSKKLAYNLYADTRSFNGIPGFQFKINSPYANPGKLEYETLGLMSSFAGNLSNISEIDFDNAKVSLLEELNSDFTNLDAEISHYWYALRHENAIFDYREKIALELDKVTKETFLLWYQNRFVDDSRKILSVLVEGRNSELSDDWFDENESSIIEDFKGFYQDQNKWPSKISHGE